MMFTLRFFGLVFGALLVVSVISLASGWLFGISKTFQPKNVFSEYQWFFDYKSNFDSRVAQIASQKQLVSEVVDVQSRMELESMKMSCRTLANDYNNRASMINKQLFMSNSLPSMLDDTKCN